MAIRPGYKITKQCTTTVFDALALGWLAKW
jgi:hypothetical protein